MSEDLTDVRPDVREQRGHGVGACQKFADLRDDGGEGVDGGGEVARHGGSNVARDGGGKVAGESGGNIANWELGGKITNREG